MYYNISLHTPDASNIP